MECDDFILFPGLCDHAEHGGVLLAQKAQSFCSALASAILSDNLLYVLC